MNGLEHARATSAAARVLLVSTLTLASAGLPAAPAAGAEDLTCTAVDVARFSPGISFVAGESTLEIRSEESAMHCVGAINGHEITGPVTYSATGTATGDCTSGSGVIDTWNFAFPTAAGIQRVSSTGEFSYVGPQGSFNSSAYDGTFVFGPIDGSCLDGVTASLVLLQGTFPAKVG